jgi:hypothetical protein
LPVPTHRFQKLGRVTLLLFAVLLAGAGVACAQVLIIDVSNPSAVTFTGTGTFASANFNGGTTAAFPVRVSGFFTSSLTNFDVLATSTTLATTGSNHTLGRAFLRVGAGGPTTLLFRQDGNSQENFSTSNAAFTGTGTFDLSAYSTSLPGAGATGSIYAADGTTVIGTYLVTTSAIPEPSTYALIFGLAGLAWAIGRRHLRRKI